MADFTDKHHHLRRHPELRGADPLDAGKVFGILGHAQGEVNQFSMFNVQFSINIKYLIPII